jgi:light-regulated signal transduction histidine kinase (bacteriophytochrome)
MQNVVTGTVQMQHLIKDLLSYSQTLKAPEMKSTNLEDVMREMMKNLAGALDRSEGKITWDPLPAVLVDPIPMVQLFQNLVGNALKYRKKDEPPRVRIAATKTGKEWVFSISDNGIGIDPQYAERIFAIYQRLHSNKEIPGTGIGLAICKKIVERHGGRIWVKSDLKKGSTFYFTLPVKD